MKNSLLLCFVASCFLGCDVADENISTASFALGTDITVNDLTDEINTDGDCSIREAFRAAQLNQAVDQCPAGVSNDMDRINLPAGTVVLVGSPGENNNLGGDLDTTSHLWVRGVGATRTIINANNIDRAFDAVNATQQINIIFEHIEIRNGCANGGACGPLLDRPGVGGGIYHDAGGTALYNDIRITASRGNNGGGFSLCNDGIVPHTIEIRDSEIDNNIAGAAGGGGVFTHRSLLLTRVNIHHNQANSSGASFGGGVRVADRTTTIIDSTITNNSSTQQSGGGIAITGQNPLGSSRGLLYMTGGSLTNNTANGHGGNLYLNGGSGGTDLGSNAYCGAGGCFADLTNVLVSMGTSDSPTSYPAGNGGGIAANMSAPSNDPVVNIRGSSSVSGNADNSSGLFAPDCWGTISLFSPALVGNNSGCTIIQTGPVCGNSMVQMGEQCDDGNTTNGDCCSSTCQYESSGSSCTDSNVCTIGDQCNGSGTCVAGLASPCGDGTLQVSCGEECDDSNTVSNDGCSSMCQTETCIQWQ